MNPLVSLVSILLSLLAPWRAPATDVDAVVRKAAIYERVFESAVMDIVAVEQYEQKTSRTASLYAAANSTLLRSGTVERHVNADIVMFQDGNLLYPVRCVRNQDGLGAEVPDYAHKEAIAALGNRPNAKAFRRTFNLPTVPLMTLHPANLGSRSARKVGEEKVDGQQTWKVEFDPKFPQLEPSVVTLWIQPNTGEIYRSLVEVHAPGLTIGGKLDGAFNLHMSVDYALNRRFGKLLPISMKENYDDPAMTIEGNAAYTYTPRLLPETAEPRAKTDTPSADTSEFKLAVDVPLVTLDVSVSGEKGAVTNLSAADFIVEENGVRQTISHFTPATMPYNILLLLDWSGSTVVQRNLLEQAASGFVGQLRHDDWVAIGRFAGSLEMDGWTTVQAQAAQRLSQLNEFASDGSTNLYTALEKALTGELLSFVGRRRALVLLTDGRDNGFEVAFMLQQVAAGKDGRYKSDVQRSITSEAQRFNRLLEIVKQERVGIDIIAVNTFDEAYPIGVPQPEVKMREFRKAVDQRFDQIVAPSGGRVVHANTYADVLPLINQVSRELGTAYTLGYYSTATDASGYRNIRVRTKQGGMSVVQSRSGYSLE